MLQLVNQARTAISHLNPEAVRGLAQRPVHFGLVSSTPAGFADMENFLIPRPVEGEVRVERYGLVHRADDPNPPADVDYVLYEEGLMGLYGEGPGGSQGAAVFHRGDPRRTIAGVLASNEDMAVPLARQFPVFRHAVVEWIIHSIARENALFALATALPDVVPNLVELPWVLGEWASDTAFLTANQFRMAFLIAAACGRRAGFADQQGQILSIAAGAFGWRAIARELAGKIPFGGGLIPKGAIAYAGTYVVGKALERWQHTQTRLAREERRKLYETALERGRTVVRNLIPGESR
jgi:hypothetical protein